MSIRLRILGLPVYKEYGEFTSFDIANQFKMENKQVRGAIYDMYNRREIDKVDRVYIGGDWYDVYRRRRENNLLRRPWVNWHPESKVGPGEWRV